MLEVKFKLNINGVIDKIGNCQNVDTAVIQETLVMYPVNKHVLNLQILYHQNWSITVKRKDDSKVKVVCIWGSKPI